MDRRFLTVWGVSLLFALVVSGVYYQFARGPGGGAASSQPEQKSLVVAAKPLAVGDTIQAEDLKLFKIPATAFPKGGFSKLEDEVAGKEASFVVGGEFPVPIAQGGANVGAVTIVCREFGVQLTFNPQITEHGTIKLHVRPEVSTLDFANPVTLSGFTVPPLAARRVETHIELAPGQSFVIGGMMEDRVTENLSRIPGLASVPVLGALFKSRSESRSKTELMALVIPGIAEPIEPGADLPAPSSPEPFLPTVREKSSSAERRRPGEARARIERKPSGGRRNGMSSSLPSSSRATIIEGPADTLTANQPMARHDRPASLREGRESGLSAIPDPQAHSQGRVESRGAARR